MWSRKKSSAERGGREMPALLLNALTQLDGASLILAPGEVAIFASEEAANIGILRDGRIQSEELLASVRVIRRTNVKEIGTIEIARGPIG